MSFEEFWGSLKDPLVKHYDEYYFEERDEAYIRDKVLTKLFPTGWITQQGIVRKTGKAVFEMLYVTKVLGNKDRHRGVDAEIWSIAEWIQKKGLITK